MTGSIPEQWRAVLTVSFQLLPLAVPSQEVPFFGRTYLVGLSADTT